MNAEVATDSLNVLNRHMAHMAESVIHSSTATSTTPTSKGVEDCVSFFFLFLFFYDGFDELRLPKLANH